MIKHQDARGWTGTIITAALATWGLWCLLHTGPLLRDWLEALKWMQLLTVKYAFSRAHIALTNHLIVLVLAFVFAIGITLMGLPASIFILRKTPNRTERNIIGLLLGFSILGSWYFGLALVGLLFKPIVWFSFVSALFMPGKRKLLMDTKGCFYRKCECWRPWYMLGFIPFAAAALMMLLPDTNGDVYSHHYASIEQFLKTHRFTVEGTAVWLQYPLTTEFIYALAIAHGDDVLPHFIQFIPFMAATILLVGWCHRQQGAGAGLLALGGVTSFCMVNQLMIIAKNDLSASAYVIAGAIFMVRALSGYNRQLLCVSAVLCGCGAAIKYNNLVLLVVCWACGLVAWNARGRKLILSNPSLLVISLFPILPWMAKSWLMLGDPVWPLFAAHLPNAIWDDKSEIAMRTLFHWRDFNVFYLPYQVATTVLENQPVLAILAPIFILRARYLEKEARWLVVFSTAGLAVLWVFFPEGGRYALSAFVLIAGCFAVTVRDLARGLTPYSIKRYLWLAIITSCLPTGGLLSRSVELGHAYPYLIGRISRDEYLSRKLTTYWSVIHRMESIRDLCTVMEIGDSRCYGMPGKHIFQRNRGRTWAWVLARECVSVETIHKRFKQLGCTYMMYNFVKEGYPDASSVPYVWTHRAIRLWRNYAGRGLEVVVVPENVDMKNGGFCVYRIRNTLLPVSPKHLPYLPGLGYYYDRISRHSLTGDAREWLRESLDLYALVPDVDHISSLVGHGYLETNQWAKAYAFFMPSCRHGTVSAENYFGAAWAAAHLGKREEACLLFDRAVKVYPLLKEPVDLIKKQLRAEIERKVR